MGGGLMQLVAYGAQDVYLTGNPQITFFKVVYRRHTNFSCEDIEQTFNGNADFGRTVTCNINRNGDLVSNMCIQVTINPAVAEKADDTYNARAGYALIESVKIEIGGSKIDEHTGNWMNIWHELTHDSSHDEGYKHILGGKTYDIATVERTFYIPLQFWFCRNPGLALPLIALQYHDVRVTVKFNSFANITTVNQSADTAPTMKDAILLTEYVYLDSEERKRFAQASHEYLIEQVQDSGAENVTNGSTDKYRLNFNHPCKCLVWVGNNTNKTVFNYTNHNTEANGTNPVDEAVLQLNGHDRFAKREGSYFNFIQPQRHFSNTPADGINVYSFAINPEEHQPSGTCNFSRIDNATLNIKWNGSVTDSCNIYAVNYNVLRIMSGMGGPAYSN